MRRRRLRLIAESVGTDAHIIDVGGGASVLVDDLLDAGYRNLTVLDLAESALAVSQTRLGERAQSVQWLVARCHPGRVARGTVRCLA